MKLYFRYFAIHLRSQMQYRASFFLTLIGQFVLSFSMFFGVYFMMERFGAIEGFTPAQVFLCYAVAMMAFSLSECFFRGFDTFDSLVSSGEFDRILVRPRSAVLQVIGARIDFSRLGKLAQALLVLLYAVLHCGVEWDWKKALLLLAMIVSGMAVFSALFLLYAALSFFTTQGLEIMNIFTDGGKEFGAYPFAVYGSTVLKFLTFVVPLALFQYYPLLYLLGRSDRLVDLFCPLLALLFLLPCYLMWRIGVRHYRSTGS